MSLGNPTQLQIGQTGNFFNRTYRIIGRAVLGVIEAGQLYYWNEFYLESAGGGPATLVFEETETGCAWRLFTMFDPPTPMTAGEAGSKKEGDIVNLDGAPLRITRVDRSQVYLVEGKTPQGIAMGKVANYFNADAGPRQIVVSWTGEEIEYYSGMSTSAPMVASAFKLQGFAAWRFMASNGRSWWNRQILMPVGLGLALICLPLACFLDLSRSRRMSVVSLVAAPVSSLRVGASGVLNEENCKIIGHELVEMDEVRRRWQRHEYDLSGPDNDETHLMKDSTSLIESQPSPAYNDPSSLVCETASNAPVWLRYTPLHPDDPLTPMLAGGKTVGQTVKVNGKFVFIRELFSSTVRSAEGVVDRDKGEVWYGFMGAMNSNQVLLVRWNQSNIVYLQGTPVPAKAVSAAFGDRLGKQTP
jgi:hypothetical protein